jgi:excisionase family DNA binding protein
MLTYVLEVNEMAKQFLTTGEAARILGISRIAVFKRIKSGAIKASKVGNRYNIEPREIGLLYRDLTGKDKTRIRMAVRKVLREYGEVLRKLGSE